MTAAAPRVLGGRPHRPSRRRGRRRRRRSARRWCSAAPATAPTASPSQLGKLGVSAAPIHGGRSQPQRDRALKAFSQRRRAGPRRHRRRRPRRARRRRRRRSSTSTRRRTVRPTCTAPAARPAPARPASSCRSSSGAPARTSPRRCKAHRPQPQDHPPRRPRPQGRDAERADPSRRPRPVPTSRGAPSTPVAATTPALTSQRHGSARARPGPSRSSTPERGFGFIDQGDGHRPVRPPLQHGVADHHRPAREFAVREGRRGLEAYDVVAV